MAVMLRSIGIPARVAVGFTAGTFDDATDSLRVTTENAHAWVEVLFPGYGWLTFEPTPGRTRPVAAYPYTDPTSTVCQARPGHPCNGCGTGPDDRIGTRRGPGGPTGRIKDGVGPAASNLPPLADAAGSIPTSPCPSPRAASPFGRRPSWRCCWG